MRVETTPFKDCFILHPRIFNDDRGYFFESYNQVEFQEKTGLNVSFVQDNQSFSQKGTLRGLHYQGGVHQQAKLIRVIQGEILDVIVDLRKDSPTFGHHMSLYLNSEDQKQLFIPKGFAHGFLVLSETAIFSYKCDAYYAKEAEGGIRYSDPILAIDWPRFDEDYIISEKDVNLPLFHTVKPL